MNATRALSVLVVLQTLTLLGVWSMNPRPHSAEAQVPDGGAQRAAAVDELKAVNARLDKLLAILSDGQLQVRVAPADEKK